MRRNLRQIAHIDPLAAVQVRAGQQTAAGGIPGALEQVQVDVGVAGGVVPAAGRDEAAIHSPQPRQVGGADAALNRRHLDQLARGVEFQQIGGIAGGAGRIDAGLQQQIAAARPLDHVPPLVVARQVVALAPRHFTLAVGLHQHGVCAVGDLAAGEQIAAVAGNLHAEGHAHEDIVVDARPCGLKIGVELPQKRPAWQRRTGAAHQHKAAVRRGGQCPRCRCPRRSLWPGRDTRRTIAARQTRWPSPPRAAARW